MGRRLSLALRVVAHDPVRTDIGLHAASGAYYLFLSLGPLIALLLSIVPYIPVTEQQIMDLLLVYTPEAFRQMVYMILTQLYDRSLAVFGLSLAAELWSAGKFFSSLLRGIGEIYDGRRMAGFLLRRLIGAIYTLGLILFLLANLGLHFFGEALAQWARSRFPIMESALAVVLPLRKLLFPAALTAASALLFWLAPRRKQRFLPQLPGAVLATAAWFLFSRVYSLLVERFQFFSVYGSLAIIVLSLFWMYCSLYILFLGAWLNTRLKNICPHAQNNNKPVKK